MSTCKNCSAVLEGKYCSNCGQKSNPPRFTFAHILEEGIHAFTHADKNILIFIKLMIVNPGKLAYDYIVEGKRKRYFSPFTFFVLITAFSAFTRGLDISIKEHIFHENNPYGHIVDVYSKILSLAAIPLVAVFLRLIHRRSGIVYSEYTVFAMMLWSQFCIISAVVNLLNYALTVLTHSSVGLQDHGGLLLLLISYLALADYQFHRQMGKASILKSLLSGTSFFLTWIFVEIFVIYAFVNHFQGLGIIGDYGLEIIYQPGAPFSIHFRW